MVCIALLWSIIPWDFILTHMTVYGLMAFHISNILTLPSLLLVTFFSGYLWLYVMNELFK